MTMESVSSYRAPEPVLVETVVDGQWTEIELAGDVKPDDAPGSIIADLAAAGVLLPATPPKGKKPSPPEES